MRTPILSTTLALAALAATWGCTVQGAIMGTAVAAQALFITEADEIKIGRETRDKVLSEYPPYPNPVLRDYLTELGQKLVAHSERKNLKYEWYVVDSKEINAFAAPGGFVFVTTGALRLMKNEAMLAGVVGHEIGHVAKYHSINSIKQALVAQGVVTGVLGDKSDQLAKMGANVAANLILKHGDRNQELESDRLGAEYAYKLGYDPRELGGFLGDLSKQAGETPAWLTWFSDHPGTNDRLRLLDEHFKIQKWSFSGVEKGQEAYRTKVLATLGVSTPTPSAAPSAVPSAAPSAAPSATPSPDAGATPLPATSAKPVVAPTKRP